MADSWPQSLRRSASHSSETRERRSGLHRHDRNARGHREARPDPVALLGSVESLLLTNQTTATQWLSRQLALLSRSALPLALREALVTVIQAPLSSMSERAQVLSAALGPMALLERGEFFESFATLATEHAHAWKTLVLEHFAATPPTPVPPSVLVQTLRALELEAVIAFALYRSLPRPTSERRPSCFSIAAARLVARGR